MEVRFLGAHAYESKDTGAISILIDGVLCIDSGSVARALTFDEQGRLKALLLTHRHFDHVHGVPALGINLMRGGGKLDVYALGEVLEDLREHLINGIVYPRFDEELAWGGPSLRLVPLDPCRETEIAGYAVTAIPVAHGVPAVGYQVIGPDGASLFYTGDTSGDLASAWEHIEPDLLIAETTLPNANRGMSNHMAAADLEAELRRYAELKGPPPRVLVVHMIPWEEDVIRREVGEVARRLGMDIQLASEDMTAHVQRSA